MEQRFDHEEPKTRFIGLLMGVTVVALIVILLLLQVYFDRVREQQVFVKVLAPVAEDLRELRAREHSDLNSYRYVDRGRGVVRIPIERAMELLIAEAAAGKFAYPTRPAPIKPEAPQGGALVAAGK